MRAQAAFGRVAPRFCHGTTILAPCRNVSRTHPAARRHVQLCSSSSGSATATTVQTEELLLLDQNTFYPYLEEAGDTLVVVDFFTDWCGPCKVIYPELLKLAKERPDIRVVKFNCNKANKELGVKLAIKVAPTFHLYKNSVKVSEMTGAKLEQLLALIDKACEPAASDS